MTSPTFSLFTKRRLTVESFYPAHERCGDKICCSLSSSWDFDTSTTYFTRGSDCRRLEFLRDPLVACHSLTRRLCFIYGFLVFSIYKSPASAQIASHNLKIGFDERGFSTEIAKRWNMAPEGGERKVRTDLDPQRKPEKKRKTFSIPRSENEVSSDFSVHPNSESL